MIRREPDINVDLDKDRVREIVGEALRMIREHLGEELYVTDEEVLDKVEGIISTNKISCQFYISIGSRKIPDLELRVDPVRKEVLCKSSFRKKVAKINRFLRIL